MQARTALQHLIDTHNKHKELHSKHAEAVSVYRTLMESISGYGLVCKQQETVNALCRSLWARSISATHFVMSLASCGMACSDNLANEIVRLQVEELRLRNALEQAEARYTLAQARYQSVATAPKNPGWNPMRFFLNVKVN